METALVLVACVVAAVNAQFLGPMSTLGMGGVGWGSPMWHGVRYPGMMQTSQVNSMTYPTWRSHPIFRIPSTADKNFGANVPSDAPGVSKPPSTQEVLTHMALAVQNPKPYLDTIADFLYEPQKARTVLTPVVSVPSIASLGSVASVAPAGTKSYLDTASEFLYEPQKTRTVLTPMTSTSSVSSVASVPPVAPVYMQGLNLMKAVPGNEDCVQDGVQGARWERGMDWLY